MVIRHIPQIDPMGCAAACLAMVIGDSYAHVAVEFRAGLFAGPGADWWACDDFLFDRGFAVRRFFDPNRNVGDYQYTPTIPRPWPPAPFAPFHIAQVLASQEAKCSHFVVMLSDGSILDPQLDATPLRLADYPRVYTVAGIYRVEAT